MQRTYLDGGHQRLKQLRLAELAEEAEHGPAHVLVGVVQVVAQGVAHQNHLVEELLGGAVVLGHHLCGWEL